MARARDGDRQEFGTLVTRHMQRAYYAALALTGGHDDALDVSQDAFVRAYRGRATMDPERPFYPWLYQIVRRLAFNHHRSRARRRRLTEEAANWLVTAAPRGEADPAAALVRAEERAELRDAIGRLVPLRREALALRVFEQLTYQEIADLLQIPIGTVMSRLYAARR